MRIRQAVESLGGDDPMGWAENRQDNENRHKAREEHEGRGHYEFGLISRIADFILPRHSAGVLVGIGDDVAVLQVSPGRSCSRPAIFRWKRYTFTVPGLLHASWVGRWWPST